MGPGGVRTGLTEVTRGVFCGCRLSLLHTDKRPKYNVEENEKNPVFIVDVTVSGHFIICWKGGRELFVMERNSTLVKTVQIPKHRKLGYL